MKTNTFQSVSALNAAAAAGILPAGNYSVLLQNFIHDGSTNIPRPISVSNANGDYSFKTNNGLLVTGIWYQTQSFFRLEFTGTGAVQISTQDTSGNISNNVIVYALNAVTNLIKTYVAENTSLFMLVFPNTITVQYIA